MNAKKLQISRNYSNVLMFNINNQSLITKQVMKF